MTQRRGRALRACLAVLIALAALLLGTCPAAALSDARQRARDAARELVARGGLGGPQPDALLVARAWRAGGADPALLDRALAAPGPPGSEAGAARALFLALCGAITPGPQLAPGRSLLPSPGDLVLYHQAPVDADPATPVRVGIFTTEEDVAVWDPLHRRPVILPREQVLSGLSRGDELRVADGPGATICSIKAAVVPSAGDVAPRAGAITLVAPDAAAARLQWAVEHPHDAEQSLGHLLAQAGGFATAPLALLVSFAANGVDSLAWLLDGIHDRLGTLGTWLVSPGLLLAWAGMRLLRTSFDGRLAHRVLTWVAVVTLALLSAGVIGGALLLALGAGLHLAAAMGVPAVGHLADLMWNVPSTVVDVLTGVEDRPRVSVGVVALTLAVGGGLMRPAWLAARFAGLAAPGVGGGGRRLIAALLRAWRTAEVAPGAGSAATVVLEARGEDLAVLDTASRGAATRLRAGLSQLGDLGDLLQLRPTAVGHSLAHLGAHTGGGVDGLAGALGVAPRHPAAGARLLGRGADALSLSWRWSSAASDLCGYTGEVARWLAARPKTSPHLAAALGDIANFSTVAHVRSGARVLGGFATGTPPAPPTLPALSAAQPDASSGAHHAEAMTADLLRWARRRQLTTM